MKSTLLTLTPVDKAIIRALRRHPEGIRYNDLYRESTTEEGKCINGKTYDKHLKWLVAEEIANRFAEGRARVIYKLRPTKAEEKNRRIRETGLENLITKPLASLFERRKELTEEQIKEEFDKIIHEAVIRPIGNNFVFAVVAASEEDTNPAEREYPYELSILTDEAMEWFREGAKAVSRAIWNDKTGRFFTQFMMTF